MIVHITPDIEIDKNVALVGSSGNLLNNSYGKEIDSFVDVIRFNRAPTKGYEDYVGSKSTIRCTNGHVFKGTPPDKRFDIKTQNPNFIKNESNSKIVVVEYQKAYGDGKKYIHETSEVFFMENLGSLSKKYGLNKMPTIGFRMVYILLKNNYTPTLYGFGLDE